MKKTPFLFLLVLLALLLAPGRSAVAEEPRCSVVVSSLSSTTLNSYIDTAFSVRPAYRIWWSRFVCRWGFYRAASRAQ